MQQPSSRTLPLRFVGVCVHRNAAPPDRCYDTKQRDWYYEVDRDGSIPISTLGTDR